MLVFGLMASNQGVANVIFDGRYYEDVRGDAVNLASIDFPEGDWWAPEKVAMKVLYEIKCRSRSQSEEVMGVALVEECARRGAVPFDHRIIPGHEEYLESWIPQFPKSAPIIGVEISRKVGRFVFDFLVNGIGPSCHCAVECDGVRHRYGGTPESDKMKDEFSESIQRKMFRFRDEDILGDPSKCARSVISYALGEAP
jgi:hypothetical protein